MTGNGVDKSISKVSDQELQSITRDAPIGWREVKGSGIAAPFTTSWDAIARPSSTFHLVKSGKDA